jgi:hypothetical protein
VSQAKIIATVDEENGVKPSANNTLDDKPYGSITKDQEYMDPGRHHRPWLLQRIRSGRVNRRKRGYVSASR